MYSGVETRVPFTDHRLIEYVWNIPFEMMKIDDIPKGILRRAVKGILPEDILYRPKTSYPSTVDPDYENAVKQALLPVLNDENATVWQLFDRKKVIDMIKGVIKPPGNDFDSSFLNALGNVLLFSLWMKKYNIKIELELETFDRGFQKQISK